MPLVLPREELHFSNWSPSQKNSFFKYKGHKCVNQNQQTEQLSSEDLDQPAHQHSKIKVFNVHIL